MKNDQPIFFGPPSARHMFLQLADEHDLELMEREAAALEELSGGTDWCIAAIRVKDWFQDLTPWPAAPVFGRQGFGDGAARTLDHLLDEVIPAIERDHPATERAYILCGYSLAGLFSLWAAYQTDRFAGVAAVSPSVWYPGWTAYAAEHPLRTPRVYLSLGDKEEKAKNPTMAAVGDAIRAQHRLLEEGGVRCRLEWNPGNHFVDSDRRTAKGLAWLLAELTQDAGMPADGHGDIRLPSYDGKRVRITTAGGLVLEGEAEWCPSDYSEHEFGRAEESLTLRYPGEPETDLDAIHYQLFADDIANVVILGADGGKTKEGASMDMQRFRWTREPAAYTAEDGRVTITTRPHTDLWQRTYYHFRNDNAPVFQTETEERYFSFVVKTSFEESHHRFDQCGVVLYLDSENWLKASVEYENASFQHLGSVVTNRGYSDWATTEIPAEEKTMWYRLSRREDDYRIECSQDGILWKQMRICHLAEGGGAIRFGVYACSPEDSSFTAVFTNMALTECAWQAHDGQPPDAPAEK